MKPCTIILPSSLMSAFAVDTKASDLDSTAISQIFAALLTARGKHLPSQTWLRKWKTDYWTRLLFSRMSQLSLGNNMLHTWLEGFFLSDGLANQSLALENEKPQKTNDGCLTSLQMEFPLCAQDSSSQRMLKDSCQLKCLTDHWYSPIASIDWKAYITKLRQAYSARLNAARLTSASECLSWPTAAARDYKGTSPGYLFRADGKSRVDQLPVAVDQAEAGNWPTPTVQEAGKIGNQANHGQLALSNHPALRGEVTREKFEKGKHGPAALDNPNTHGSRPESWATPRAADAAGVDYQYDQGNHAKPRLMLPGQVKAWATPTARDHKSGRGNEAREYSELTPMVERTQSGKLNPRWVETLMGLPVGWTMPSCVSPVTIAPTSCASLATESFRLQQH